MKALLIITFPGTLSMVRQGEVERHWTALRNSNFNKPLVISDGGRAEVLYLPDNFLEANVFTPAEVELLLEKIKSAGVVIGVNGLSAEN